MNVGGHLGARARPSLRAAVNARLEEISFRTGLITATIALAALSAIAAAGMYMAIRAHSSPPGSTVGALSVGSAPVTPLTAPASLLPHTAGRPPTSPRAKAQQPAAAGTTRPQPPAGPQPWVQSGSWGPAGPQVRSGDYGRASLSGLRSSYGGHRPWHDGSGILAVGGWGGRH